MIAASLTEIDFDLGFELCSLLTPVNSAGVRRFPSISDMCSSLVERDQNDPPDHCQRDRWKYTCVPPVELEE